MVAKVKETMEGRVMSEKELKAEGWEFVLHVPDTVHRVFGKGDKRIFWDKETHEIKGEYTYKPPKSSVKSPVKDVSSPSVPFFISGLKTPVF